jgi:hypothetical protein
MKKLFFFVSLPIIILATTLYPGCKKSNVQHSSLIANAGSDTIINMPQPNSLWVFMAILNGGASYSSGGQIVFYSWTAIDNFGSSSISFPNSDSTEVIFNAPISNKYRFRLEVRDFNNNVAYDTVTITINRKFQYEYDGLSWDSTVGLLTYLIIDGRFGNGNFPLFGFGGATPGLSPNIINLCTFNGNCNDISSWKSPPYVPYDSIKLTNQNLFYSSDSLELHYVIYATPGAGIDFTQKLSVGVYRLQ